MLPDEIAGTLNAPLRYIEYIFWLFQLKSIQPNRRYNLNLPHIKYKNWLNLVASFKMHTPYAGVVRQVFQSKHIKVIKSS